MCNYLKCFYFGISTRERDNAIERHVRNIFITGKKVQLNMFGLFFYECGNIISNGNEFLYFRNEK